MTNRWLILVCFLIISGSACAADDKQDLEKMKGTWSAEKMVAGGMELPAEFLKEMKFVIDGNKIYEKEKKEMAGTIKLDSSKTPKVMDVETSDGKKLLGIYEQDGNTLKMCFGEKDRPKEFKSEQGSETILFVLKRAN